MDIPGLFSQRLVFLIKLGVFSAGDRVIRIAVRARKLINDAGFCMLLAGQMFELRHPGESIIVRVIDHRHRLIMRLVQGLVLKLEATIRKLSILVIKVFIDRPGEDQLHGRG